MDWALAAAGAEIISPKSAAATKLPRLDPVADGERGRSCMEGLLKNGQPVRLVNGRSMLDGLSIAAIEKARRWKPAGFSHGWPSLQDGNQITY
jgi:hypothetical protein